MSFFSKSKMFLFTSTFALFTTAVKLKLQRVWIGSILDRKRKLQHAYSPNNTVMSPFTVLQIIESNTM